MDIQAPTLSVSDVELVDLLGELVLLDGLGARDGQRKTPLEVLHLVHDAVELSLPGEERRRFRKEDLYPFVRQSVHSSIHPFILSSIHSSISPD